MGKAEKIISRITGFLDLLGGIAVVAVMLLVVANIALRLLVNGAILGTYEFVGFITALVTGLALAHCAYGNGHIAIEFLVEKFPQKVQLVVGVIVFLVSAAFLAFAAYHIYLYGYSMVVSGQVSPTTKTPYYPFIYATAVGFLFLCLIYLFKMVEILRKGKAKKDE